MLIARLFLTRKDTFLTFSSGGTVFSLFLPNHVLLVLLLNTCVACLRLFSCEASVELVLCVASQSCVACYHTTGLDCIAHTSYPPIYAAPYIYEDDKMVMEIRIRV